MKYKYNIGRKFCPIEKNGGNNLRIHEYAQGQPL